MNKSDMALVAAKLKAMCSGACPHCGRRVEHQVPQGRWVYGLPCGHRLYQGTVGAFTHHRTMPDDAAREGSVEPVGRRPLEPLAPAVAAPSAPFSDDVQPDQRGDIRSVPATRAPLPEALKAQIMSRLSEEASVVAAPGGALHVWLARYREDVAALLALLTEAEAPKALCEQAIATYAREYAAAVKTGSDAGWGESYGRKRFAEQVLALLNQGDR